MGLGKEGGRERGRQGGGKKRCLCCELVSVSWPLLSPCGQY